MILRRMHKVSGNTHSYSHSAQLNSTHAHTQMHAQTHTQTLTFTLSFSLAFNLDTLMIMHVASVNVTESVHLSVSVCVS